MSRFRIGQPVEVVATGTAFTVAGVDGDCVLRAEDGAWLHEDDLDDPVESAPHVGHFADAATVRFVGRHPEHFA